MTIQDASQQTLLNQTVENTVYPFSTMLLTTHTVRGPTLHGPAGHGHLRRPEPEDHP